MPIRRPPVLIKEGGRSFLWPLTENLAGMATTLPLAAASSDDGIHESIDYPTCLRVS